MGKNLSTPELLMERFPKLGLLTASLSIQEWREKPSKPFHIGSAEALYYYGLNTSAYLLCKEWLQKNPKNTLIFLEKTPERIASFLSSHLAAEILSNTQVHIDFPEIDALAEQFPFQRIEVIAPKSLRLQILRKTALSHALHLDRVHGYQPFQNFLKNSKQLATSFYANALKGAFKNIPAVICGAGPSLEISTLRGLENKALLIAGGSTLAALSSKGILPHFGMAVDPNLEEYRRLKNSFAFEVPLLYSTRVVPSTFQTCNGPFGYMRTGIGGVAELWLEEELGLLEPLIGENLSPESLSVTTICVAWAQFLGCNPILLNGIDLAYTNNQRYASGVTEAEMGFEPTSHALDQILKRKDRKGNPVFTAVRWVMESASLSAFAKSHPKVRIINTTDGGLGFKGIEYVPLAEATRDFKSLELRKQVHEKIQAAPMPHYTDEKVKEKIEELRLSLERVIEWLQILAGEKKGSAALAEMEIKEEIATLYLFYDVAQVFKEDLWKNWLGLARKYRQVFKIA